MTGVAAEVLCPVALLLPVHRRGFCTGVTCNTIKLRCNDSCCVVAEVCCCCCSVLMPLMLHRPMGLGRKTVHELL